LGWVEICELAPFFWGKERGLYANGPGLQGGEKYQQAFYVYEELAQAPATSSVRSLVSQAVAELHLGRTEEAEQALEQALKKEPEYAEAIANFLVLSVITGKDAKELTRYVALTVKT
jgi:Flp pilus assembly protein TadD